MGAGTSVMPFDTRINRDFLGKDAEFWSGSDDLAAMVRAGFPNKANGLADHGADFSWDRMTEPAAESILELSGLELSGR